MASRMELTVTGKYVKGTTLFMALSLFLRAVFYLGITNFVDINFIEVIFCAILPLIASGGYIVLLSGMHRNDPELYGKLGAAFSAFLLIATFFTGNFLRIILGVVWYAVAGCVVYLSCIGRLNNKSMTVALFVIPIPVRILLSLITKITLFDWVLELSGLFLLASLAYLPMMLHRKKKMK